MKQTVEEAAKAFAEECRIANIKAGLDYPYDEIDMRNAFEGGVQWQAKQSPWISIKERLPNPLEEVILYDKNSIRHYAVGWLREDKGYNKSMWCVTDGFVEDKYITHWMPIPALPKGGEE